MTSVRLLLFLTWVSLVLSCSEIDKKKDIYIFSAVSASSALNLFEKEYEARHKNIDLKINYASSSTLARQIEAGAPADIFVSADKEWVDYLIERKFRTRESVFLASNTLVIVSKKVKADSLSELLQKSETIALPEVNHVPLGRYAKRGLECQKLWTSMIDRVVPNQNARTTTFAILKGLVDTGITYQTEIIPYFEELNVYYFSEDCNPKTSYQGLLVGDSADERISAEILAELQDDTKESVWSRQNFR